MPTDAPTIDASSRESASETVSDTKAQQRADAQSLKDLMSPVSSKLSIGRLLAAISGILAVVPYIALVHIGDALLGAAREGSAVDADEVDRWLRILLITFALRLLVYFVALLITHLADIELGHLIRRRMIRRFSRVPLVWFTSTNSGRVRKALQDDIGTIHQLIAHRPVEVTNAVVMPVALMIYAFIIDWRLGLLAIATLPLYVAAMAFSMRGMGEKTVQMDKRLGIVSARMVEFVTGITVVKAFGRVGRAHRAYQHAAEEFHDFYYAWVRPLITVSALGNSLLAVPLILLVNIGGGTWLVHQGWVTAPDVLATSLIALLVPYGLEILMGSMWAQQMAGASARRLTDLLETPVLDDEPDPVVPDGHEVVFDRVSYAYGSDEHAELALDDVSFTLRQNTVTALVGPSGSGKSTIATLLARFDDPRSGQIRLGGAPVSRIEDLYTHIGFVLQDPQLPSISIRDNIALGRPDATDEQIREAARAARVLDEIDELPSGLDTVYGADTGLSGGQAQRIAIARAILVDAPVLILDEATALTDPESQHQIQQALSDLARDRTVLLVAHRPETIKGVDQIVLVESGRVVATGTHDELMDHTGYSRLWESTTATLGGAE
ncbi:ABC transporter ATP-binding protein [Aeromicrobium sp. YIM 150415]|uniref:ABC transporter ATP-binding protein n=1 Tax=Aeromicrobium sp. YIM 150415 TaxID=2803912 RepID=UPI001964E850|nr:ABC transporter ATP-binding protein [Aeromicrobium sp. YIM 150415]MBM9463643.1 ABC transporter ATP-binding protein [Aeromicrobium sp. YIM 150415]